MNAKCVNFTDKKSDVNYVHRLLQKLYSLHENRHRPVRHALDVYHLTLLVCAGGAPFSWSERPVVGWHHTIDFRTKHNSRLLGNYSLQTLIPAAFIAWWSYIPLTSISTGLSPMYRLISSGDQSRN